jgi:2',3'-cyclic-nucleotide 2'-phosphodiesterase (5'-nucleotidase family)
LWAAAVAAGCAAAITACSSSEGPRRVTIAYSNDLHGEIRSCGCAAKDYGGLGRRATFLAALRDTTGDFLLLDGGDIFSTGINYGLEKADLTLSAMARMGYHGIVVGERDFSFGREHIVERTRALGLPVVAANLFDVAADTLVFPATREVMLDSGLRVGLVGVLASRLRLPPQVPPRSLVIRDPLETIRPIVDEMRPRVDLVVVLGHMDRSEAHRLAEALPGVDLVVHGHDGRALRQVRRFGNAYVLQVSERGMYMGVAFATLGPDARIAALTNTVVPLDKSFADDEAIAKLFRVYDVSIAAREKEALPAGITDAATLTKDRYVGAETCRPCHAAFYDQWAQSEHAHAFETLASRQREFDRDCTPCHSTGFYQAGGFVSAMATPELESVQCESCHGNGAAHSRDPRVKTASDARATCRQCHTVDQTPDFEFEPFWAKIANCTRASEAAAPATH